MAQGLGMLESLMGFFQGLMELRFEVQEKRGVINDRFVHKGLILKSLKSLLVLKGQLLRNLEVLFELFNFCTKILQFLSILLLDIWFWHLCISIFWFFFYLLLWWLSLNFSRYLSRLDHRNYVWIKLFTAHIALAVLMSFIDKLRDLRWEKLSDYLNIRCATIPLAKAESGNLFR